jgi:iron-sulfur cluster repair protein YtfE (RIC family)
MEARSSAKPEKETDSIFCAPLLWIRYIELNVHKNIRRKSSEILKLIQDIQQSSTPDDRLILIEELFIKANSNLTHCIQRQELIVFPFLSDLSKCCPA